MQLMGHTAFASILFASTAFSASPAAAQTPTVFVIAASEGYGVGDCLAEGSACGQIIADAWCSAHGGARAVSFGPADAAGIAGGSSAQISPGSVMIACGE
jgi:hypothetical protein